MSEETSIVVVREDKVVAVAREEIRPVTVRVGPQGPTGPQGPVGPAGGELYIHNQTDAAATWTIDHNLGRRVLINLLDETDTLVWADIEHPTSDRTVITFPSPTAGTAIIV